MNYNKLSVASFFLIVYSTRIQSNAAEESALYPTLVMHGEPYQNSCLPQEKLGLMNYLHKNDIPDQKILKTTLETILCADNNESNSKKLFDILDSKLIESYEATGENEYRKLTVKRREFVTQIMAERNAWSANINGNRHVITLQYFE